MLILYLILISLMHVTSLSQPFNRCLNGGKWNYFSTTLMCQCPPQFIGKNCRFQATKLSNEPIQASLNNNLTFFYFPNKNYYTTHFQICMLSNPSKNPTIITLEQPNFDGSFKQYPYVIKLTDHDCRKLFIIDDDAKDPNKILRKIVIGMKIMDINGINSHIYSQIINKRNRIDSSLRPWINNQNGIDSRSWLNDQGNSVHQQALNTVKNQNQNTQYIQIFIESAQYFQSPQNELRKSIIIAVSITVMISTLLHLYQKKRQRRFLAQIHDAQMVNLNNQNRINKLYQDLIQQIIPATRYSTSQDQNSTILQSTNNKNQAHECSICLIQFKNEEQIRITPCKHIYHRQCLDIWLKSYTSCPICRHNFGLRSKLVQLYNQLVLN